MARTVPADPQRRADHFEATQESGKTTSQVAHQGSTSRQWQEGLPRCCDSARWQLRLRAEISANKYALNVRFTTATGTQRRTSVEDVSFELTFCNL